jgi:flavin-dependent dehydrogenase
VLVVGGGPSTVVLFLSARCEVLVVGGGPSGLAAALGARRAGADVILMERFGCFGGVITTVGMETLAWYRYLLINLPRLKAQCREVELIFFYANEIKIVTLPGFSIYKISDERAV